MNNSNVLSVIAIVLAAAALIVGFVAMNRTSEDNLEPIVQDQVEQTLQQLLGAPAQEPQPAPAPGFEEEGEAPGPAPGGEGNSATDGDEDF